MTQPGTKDGSQDLVWSPGRTKRNSAWWNTTSKAMEQEMRLPVLGKGNVEYRLLYAVV